MKLRKFSLKCKIIVSVGILSVFLLPIMPLSVLAQNAPQPKPCPVTFRQLRLSDYRCFTEKLNRDLQKAAEREEKVRPRSFLQQRIQAEQEEREARIQRNAEIARQRLERSRQRNVSNKGRRYRVTYGRAITPAE